MLKSKDLIIAGLLITNVATGFVVWQKSSALRSWEDVSAGLSTDAVRTAVEDMRFNEALEEPQVLHGKKKGFIQAKCNFNSSLDVLKARTLGFCATSF